MTSPQKAKGNSYERTVAQYLTKLYGETFIRAPGSGAYVGGKNQSRTQFLHEGQIRSFKGDIVPGQSFGALNAECKSYADFPFHQLYSGTVKILESWLDQLMEVADTGDFNILFMKFNRKGSYVAVQTKAFVHTGDTQNFTTYNSPKHGTWLILGYDQFFEHNTERFKELCAKA